MEKDNIKVRHYLSPGSLDHKIAIEIKYAVRNLQERISDKIIKKLAISMLARVEKEVIKEFSDNKNLKKLVIKQMLRKLKSKE